MTAVPQTTTMDIFSYNKFYRTDDHKVPQLQAQSELMTTLGPEGVTRSGPEFSMTTGPDKMMTAGPEGMTTSGPEGTTTSGQQRVQGLQALRE
jgi:hypothetical protein